MARLNKKRKFIRRIAVVGDGVTEKIYFDQLKETEQIKDVVIKPELPAKSLKGGTFKKAIKAAQSLVEDGYNHVYCLIDFDTVLSENSLGEFAQEVARVNKQKITIYINNPCFEVWLLMHYEKTGRVFNDCDAVCTTIAKYIRDYCKNQQYLRRKNLYTLLKPYLESHAIPNAKFLENRREEKGTRYPRERSINFLKNMW
jgi:hypothetical protein